MRCQLPTVLSPAAPAAVFLLAMVGGTVDGNEPSSFQREVQPILAAKCFTCHGPDDKAREADLRLDTREAATVERDGVAAIRPGMPDASELIRRVTSSDPAVRMPPPDESPLPPDEVERLRLWIAAGAVYDRHWAFVPPTKPAPPVVARSNWPHNDLDRFVLARLERSGLAPAVEADRLALARRVYLDLIGLPPTPAEAEAFAANSSPQAYEELVDQLLRSPHYGERWARLWLDLARYSDTNGYEKDRPRSIWPYRDWVIRALNDDLPYDQFSIEQLAGDMLPGAGEEQRIATGFHRNTMLNEEGGIDPLEYRFHAMVDRVAVTGTVWLGLTIGCAQCHSHKYDPISHQDYYRLMALLNNADEPDLIVSDPAIAARRVELERQIAALESRLAEQFPWPASADGKSADGNANPGPSDQARQADHLQQSFDRWRETTQAGVAPWTVVRPASMSTNSPKLEVLADGSIFSSGDITKRDQFVLTFRVGDLPPGATALRLEVLPDDRLPARGPGRCYYEGRQGDFFLSELAAAIDGQPLQLASPTHSFGKISIGSGAADPGNVLDGDGSTGWSTAGREGERHQLVVRLAQPAREGGELRVELLFERHYAASLGRFRFSFAATDGPVRAQDLPEDVELILAKPVAQWSAAERAVVLRHYLRIAPELADARQPIDVLRKQLPEFPTTLVMQERPRDNPRPTFVHHRGEYLSPRDRVEPGLPELFRPASPTNRLQFARWLASRDNPLAARVAVNRAWQAFFGVGLVKTSNDFGTQAEPPSHPELLDWLACEFMDRGWSLKQLHRLIVTSATYRQAAHASVEAWRDDSENRLLARGPRFRLEAELVRDALLQASGLLTPTVGGPSVYPPQPASVTELAYGQTAWNASRGEARYRRSLYTFSKRTAPFAAYVAFDAPTGENCVARRDRSDTPLQALTLLNDAMFLEFAAALASAALRDVPDDDAPADDLLGRRLSSIFRRVLTRPPTEDERAALWQFAAAQVKRCENGELSALAIVGVDKATAEQAALTMTARAIMNLDEGITK